jgi:hypothetical protein
MIYDLKDLLDYFIDASKERPIEDHDHPNGKNSLHAAFIKRLYVAASRPRHLLCLAMHKNHVSLVQRDALRKKGWEFYDLSNNNES